MARPEARFNITAENQTDSAFRSVRSGLQSVGDTAGRVAGTVAKIGGVATAAGGGLAYVADRALSSAQELRNLSEQTGFTVETIQELRHAGRATGLEVQTMDQALAELSQRMGEAAAEGGEMAEGFKAAGISVDGITQRRPEAVFRDLAQAIREADSASEAANIAVKAFGEEEGRQILPLLRQTAGEMANLRKEAQEMGLVMSRDTVEGASEAADQLDTLKSVISTQFVRAVSGLGPAITDFTEQLASNPQAIEDFASNLGTLAQGFVVVAEGADNAATNLRTYGEALGLLSEQDEPISKQKQLRKELVQLQNEATRTRSRIQDLQSAATEGRDEQIQAIAQERLEAAQSKLERLEAKVGDVRGQLSSLDESGGGGAGALGQGAAAAGSLAENERDATQATENLGNAVGTLADKEMANAIQQFERMGQANEELRQFLDGLAPAMNERARAQAELNRLVSAGVISEDRYFDAVLGEAEAHKQAGDATKDHTQQVKTWERVSVGAARVAGGVLEDIMVDVAEDGKVNWKELGDVVEKQLIRIATQALITDQIVSSITGAFGGGGGGGGGGGTTTASTQHSGGIVGSESGPARTVPSAAFAGAPEYHSGGMVGADEQPIIAKKGEGVFTEEQMKALQPAGGGNSSVTVINNSGQQQDVRTEEREGPDGKEIQVMIEDTIAQSAQKRGPAAQALEAHYDLKRRGPGRG
jgi:hypothetical protein